MVEFGPKNTLRHENLHFQGGEIDQKQFHFPQSLSEFREMLREVHPVHRAIEAAELMNDGARAFNKSLILDDKIKKYGEGKPKQEVSGGEVSVVFALGLGTWETSVFLKRYAPWLPRVIQGTYDLTGELVRREGIDFECVRTRFGVQMGDEEETVAEIDKVMTKKLAEGPVYGAAHSFGGLSMQLWAARNPEKAKNVRAFFLGGSPLPVKVNTLVAEAFMALQGRKTDFRAIQEIIEFSASPEAKRMKFYSLIDKNDCVLQGPACGVVVPNSAGHASIFFDGEILSGITNYITDQTQKERRGIELKSILNETNSEIIYQAPAA